ncbi:FHA domain-containing protein [Rubrivivax rivuli]|uniref:FHA domain-containing protein n=1 Tax=Rubrivivax rivuli TaxID=1862385 RepID=A0A437RCS4_9BURK|nr:FHA domain-containing protein [Rubrivivax rivuli]RVU44551.1 FHA domain-containing protein [Rubrivivax rivuli]
MERPEERVALIEWLDRDGHVQRGADVLRWPLSLGRALDNTVVLDDPHVAAHHAVLDLDAEGRLQLQALPSLNGVLLDGQAVAGCAALPPAEAVLQLGATRLRLRMRTAGEAAAALAPERALQRARPASGRRTLAAGLGVLALTLGETWLGLDPGADYSAWLPLMLGLPLALALWCGVWALLSKLFQHRFDFTGHLRIALPWLLAATLVDQLWPVLTAALALPALWMAGSALQSLLLVLMLHAHLRHTLPLHQRAVTVAVAAMAITGLGFTTALTWRGHDSLVATPYMSTLPMPALRVAGTVPSATLVEDMVPLARQLAQRVAEARKDEEEAGGSADDE